MNYPNKRTVEVDVIDLDSAFAEAREVGVGCGCVAQQGPSGWPVVVLSGDIDRVNNLLRRWDYNPSDL